MNPEDMSGGMGGSGQVPERWIGRKVQVGIEGNSRNVPGVLAEVNAGGIVLVEDARDLENPDAPGDFYPWRFVQGIRVEGRNARKQGS
jgi:hypothetical protein